VPTDAAPFRRTHDRGVSGTTPATRSLAEIQVGEAMHPGIFVCPPETPLRAVARMMATYRIHCVVVLAGVEQTDDERVPWGVVSDLDLASAAGDDVDERTAGGTAATPLVTVTADESLERAAQLMTEYQTAHLVVVDASGRPNGVLSTLDLARLLGA
jgi:CBS domain-containing protein